MAAILIKLKLKLYVNSYRGETSRIILALVAVLYGSGIMAGLTGAGVHAASNAAPLFAPVVASVLTLMIVAVLLSLLAGFSVDDTLETRKFSTLPVHAKRLLPGLFVSGFISIPMALATIGAMIAIALGCIYASNTGAGALTYCAAFIAPLLTLVILNTAPRAIAAQIGLRPSTPRNRRFKIIAVATLALAAGIGASLAVTKFKDQIIADPAAAVATTTTAISWSPFGWAPSLYSAAAAGHSLEFGIKFALSILTLVALLAWWQRSLTVGLESGAHASTDTGTVATREDFIYGIFPNTTTGVVASRCLRMWLRDRRYNRMFITLTVLTVFYTGMGLVGNSTLVGAVTIVPVIFGLSLANDFGLDGPANWIHITTSVPARADIFGRVAALLVASAPILAIALAAGTTVSIVHNDPKTVAVLALCSLGGFVGAIGGGAFMATYLPYPAAAPNTSAFKQRGGGAGSMKAGLGVLVVMTIVLGPGLILFGLSHFWSSLLWVAPTVALTLGGFMSWLGLRLAVRRLDQRRVEISQRVNKWA